MMKFIALAPLIIVLASQVEKGMFTTISSQENLFKKYIFVQF
jgi:hypothetical protein